LQSLHRPHILGPLLNHNPMKRSLIYSITVMLAAGLIASCTNKTETTTTTAPEKSPAYTKKEYKPKKYSDKTKKPYPSPTPKYEKPSPTPKYSKPSPTPKYEKSSPTPTPSPY
jgi:hypothetical protein